MTNEIRRQAWRALAVAIAAMSPAPSQAQVLTEGMIEGAVLTSSGDPLRGARVVAVSESAGTVRETTTDADGTFRFRFLPPGNYDVLFEVLGYGPKRVLGIPVRPAAAPLVNVRLRSVSGPAETIEEERFVGPAAARGASYGQWFNPAAIEKLPHPDRSLTDLARLSSTADEEFGVEGLPGSFSILRLEGIEWRPTTLTGPSSPASLVSVSGAELAAGAVDVEHGGAAGGVLSGHVAAGAGRTRLAARGTWAGDALPGAGVEAADAWADVGGEASIRGPLAGRRGGYGLGVDVRLLGQPRSEAWSGVEADALVAADLEAELAGYVTPTTREGTLVRASGALSVPVSPRHTVAGLALVHSASFDAVPGTTGEATAADALDLLGTASLASVLNEEWWNQARIGVTHASLEQDSLAIPPLVLVPGGLETASRGEPGSVEHTVITVQDALGASMGPHAIKVGAGARLERHSYAGVLNTDGIYSYGGIDELIAGTGSLVRVEPVVDEAEWSSTSAVAFAQDRWRPAADIEVVFGVRVESQPLPREEVTLDGEWLRLSGITNRVLETQPLLFSPRAAVTWTPASDWRLEAATGVHHGRYDPWLLAEWQIDAGTARVRRGVGDVSWPDGLIGGPMGLRLTLLDQEFAPPRSARLSTVITRMLGSATSVQIGAVIRRTDQLPRRSDLNLTPDPFGRDQYGRPLYGNLVKQGGLVLEEPGTSRRFMEYDEVAAINSDGESKYWGVTLGLDHDGGVLDLIARYTFSRTTDDWFGARDGGWRRALPPDLDDWVDGTSDLDVPHRGVLGAVVEAPFGLRVSGIYRVQSGLPFTPGFRVGVDANADGITGNDPAFVDPALPGMSELIGRWSCLADSSGNLAERNGCRGDAVHTVDASASLRLFNVSGFSTSVLVEGYDLLDADRRRPDAALLLIDPAASLEESDGVVTVPLMVNPEFGQPRAWPLPGRTLRVGISLNW